MEQFIELINLPVWGNAWILISSPAFLYTMIQLYKTRKEVKENQLVLDKLIALETRIANNEKIGFEEFQAITESLLETNLKPESKDLLRSRLNTIGKKVDGSWVEIKRVVSVVDTTKQQATNIIKGYLE